MCQNQRGHRRAMTVTRRDRPDMDGADRLPPLVPGVHIDCGPAGRFESTALQDWAEVVNNKDALLRAATVGKVDSLTGSEGDGAPPAATLQATAGPLDDKSCRRTSSHGLRTKKRVTFAPPASAALHTPRTTSSSAVRPLAEAPTSPRMKFSRPSVSAKSSTSSLTSVSGSGSAKLPHFSSRLPPLSPSAIGMTMYRKLYMAKLMRETALPKARPGEPTGSQTGRASAGSTRGDDHEARSYVTTDTEDDDIEAEWDDEEIVPESPRFCATLSPEAQYAMMKGYEDRLVQNLSSRLPHTGSDATVLRSRTPKQGRVQLSKKTCRGGNLSANATGTGPTNDPAEHDHRQEDGVLDGHDAKLRVSRKFQAAIDLLDNLEEGRGNQLAASKPASQRRMRNPLRRYKSWSQGWMDDFQVESNSTNGTADRWPAGRSKSDSYNGY